MEQSALIYCDATRVRIAELDSPRQTSAVYLIDGAVYWPSEDFWDAVRIGVGRSAPMGDEVQVNGVLCRCVDPSSMNVAGWTLRRVGVGVTKGGPGE